MSKCNLLWDCCNSHISPLFTEQMGDHSGQIRKLDKWQMTAACIIVLMMKLNNYNRKIYQGSTRTKNN